MRVRGELRPVLLLMLIICVLGAGLSAFARVSLLLKPLSPDADATQIVEIPQGTNTPGVADILVSKGLIRNALAFRLLAKYRKLDERIRAGEYEVSAAMSPSEILDRLVNGPIVTYPFTVREGLTVEQTASHLASQGLVDKDKFLAAARDPALVEGLLPAGAKVKEPLEGYLFPDTYRIRRGTSEKDIVRIMVARFRQVFDSDMEARAAELGMTPHQVITLASIIEKEAMVDSERGLISGVFHRRLKINMPLAADPTVRYALGKFTGPVTTADTKVSSPYNTYNVAGLPPGPIAAPGLASIRAALYPDVTDFLYFVAKNDGTHHFSLTLKDHINAINRYKPYSTR